MQPLTATELKRKIDYSLDEQDILDLTNHACTIHEYPDLSQFDSIHELFGPSKNACVLLIDKSKTPTESDGHWITCLQYDDTFEWFDR